jgi:hypothetical protein
MIARQHLKDWLEEALAFANGPQPVVADQPELWLPSPEEEVYQPGAITVGGLSLLAPEAARLWTEWRRWLATLIVLQRKDDLSRERLQRWCLKTAARSHLTRFYHSPDAARFVFDASGAPQMYYGAESVEEIIAMTGAELIAPAPAFGVMKCKRPGCDQLIVKVLQRTSKDGRPPVYCGPRGHRHSLTPTERSRRKRGG